MDSTTDKKDSEVWLNTEEDKQMNIQDLVHLVKHGFTRCDEEENCVSAKHCGEDACRCVRSLFPNPSHYDLYVSLRKKHLEGRAIEILSTSID